MFSGWTTPTGSNCSPSLSDAIDKDQLDESRISKRTPTSKLLTSSRSYATTSVAALTASSSIIEPSDLITPSVGHDEVSLSRPLSAHSTLVDRYPGKRTQSLKEGSTSSQRSSIVNLATYFEKDKRLSIRNSRQSLASTLTAHLFRSNNLNGLTQAETESQNDSHYDSNPRNTFSPVEGYYDLDPQALTPELSQTDHLLSPDLAFNSNEASANSPINLQSPTGLSESLASQSFESHGQECSSMDGTFDSNTNSDDDMSEGEVINGPSHRRKFGHEDPNSDIWRYHKHHLFILSSAGKPIYTRYSEEYKLSEYMGIIQAIISFYADDNDSIRCINAPSHKIVFMLREPLYFVLVSRTDESEEQLREYLYLFHQQIISILTSSQVARVFEKSSNFDLRRLLAGTEGFMDALASRVTGISPSYLLESVRSLRMDPKLRKALSKSLKPSTSVPGRDVLYVVLASKYKLVHLLRSPKVSLHPTDLHLLFNVLHSSPAFLTPHQASWIPICLPKFNKSGYLYALITFLSIEPPLAMVLLSPHRDKYEEVSQLQGQLVRSLENSNLLADIISAISEDSYDVSEVGIPGLRHFYFKYKQLFQYTGSRFGPPYILERERRRLFDLYSISYRAINSRFRPLRIHFSDTERETVVGWSTNTFEMFATFTPYMSKPTIVGSALKLVKWVTAHKDRLFVTNTALI